MRPAVGCGPFVPALPPSVYPRVFSNRVEHSVERRIRNMCLRRLFVCLVFSLLACLTAWGQPGKRRVIIDTDPGTDDALAILLALNSPELQVEAISVVPGNVDGKQGLENALKLASVEIG